MSMKNARRRARGVALQALYEIDCAGHQISNVLAERLVDEPLPEDVRPFVFQLVNGVIKNKAVLDDLIQRYAPEWPIEQIAVIDRNILRMAVLEILFSEDVPLRVAINEAVELAKVYGSDTAPRFVNGVLGSLAADEVAIRAEFSGKNMDAEI